MGTGIGHWCLRSSATRRIHVSVDSLGRYGWKESSWTSAAIEKEEMRWIKKDNEKKLTDCISLADCELTYEENNSNISMCFHHFRSESITTVKPIHVLKSESKVR